MNHSPEPWKYVEEGIEGAGKLTRFFNTVQDADCNNIVRFSDGDRGEANCRRIVTCVNACAGIETDALEQYGDGNIEALFKMQAQRDELLAAIEHIREYWNGDYNYTSVSNALEHIMETCDEVIEKVEAGAP